MTDVPDAAPSPAAQRAARLIEDAARAGRLSHADLLAFAAALERVGYRVHVPAPPRARGERGWYVLQWKRCNRPGCFRCKAQARPHGPYLLHRWQEKEGSKRRVRERSLGRLDKAIKRIERGRARVPDPGAALDAAKKFDARFLHDD